MLHLLLVSGAEALTSRSMIPLVGVSETLKEETSRNLHTFSVIVIADTKHSAALFLDRARIEAYAGSRVTAVQFGYLNQADKVASVPGTEPFGVGHPDGVDERIRIVHVGSVGGPQTSHPNENQVCQTFYFVYYCHQRQLGFFILMNMFRWISARIALRRIRRSWPKSIA